MIARLRSLRATHKRAFWIVAGLIVANEIRGVIVVALILSSAWGLGR